MKNVKFEILNELIKNKKYYALASVSIADRDTCCIIVEDDEMALYNLGEDRTRANEIYELLACGEVSAIHVEDIISDLKNEIFT